MFKKLFLPVLFLAFTFVAFPIFGQSVDEIQEQINQYTKKLNELGTAKNTLSNQIKLLDSQYQLTLLKITQTENSIKTLEKEIGQLNVEIGKLEIQINQLSADYINQTIQNYKLQKKIPSFAYLFSSGLNSFLEQHEYISAIQKNSQQNLINLETVRTNYTEQKTVKAEKQDELEVLQKTLANQKTSLTSQKASKNSLLEITKNDEKKYQQLKTEAEQELSSLLSAKFDGKRNVKKGDALGLMGSTGRSTGPHLHFGLYNLKESELALWSYTNDIDASAYLQSNRWPMNGNIRITQERGVTSYSWSYANKFHNGIDMVSDNKTIYAVNDGVAYFFRNAGSSLGNHVKLFHPDGKMTLYLHMQ